MIISSPGPLGFSATVVQWTSDQIQASAPSSLGYSETLLQWSEDQIIDSQGAVDQIALEDPCIQSETHAWTLLTLQAAPPPTLESGPASPNNRFTTKPMQWSVNGQGTLANIISLVIGGRTAVTNNIVQSSFSGSVVVNGIDSFNISLVANADFPDWQALYELPWLLIADNGQQAIFQGVIVKYVTLPYPDELTELKHTYLRNFDFPFRFKPDGDTVMTTDERGIEHNMRNSIMVLQRGIPLAASLGSRVPTLPFDPEDDALRALIVQEAARAVAVGEPRARLDPSLRVVDTRGTNEATVAIPYLVRSTVKWQDLLFKIPVLKTIDKSN